MNTLTRYLNTVNHYLFKSSERSDAPVCVPKKNSQSIVFSAYMIALAVIFSRFLSIKIPLAGMEALRFGIGGLPIIASGLFSGPLYGAATGALADLMGMMLFPSGPYFPVFTLTSALTGMIPGFFRNILDNKGYFLKCLFIVLVTQFSTTVTLVPLFLGRITGLGFNILFYPRLIALVIEAPFFAFFLSRLLGLYNQRHEVKAKNS